MMENVWKTKTNYVTAQMNLEMLIGDLIVQMDQMKHQKNVALENIPTHILKKYASVNLTNGNVKIVFNVLI